MNKGILMKFKKIYILLLILNVLSEAECSKNEIFKFIDKGYSKVEIDSICNKGDIVWITPKDRICTKYGGSINDNNICEAPWKEAKDICHASRGKLPNIVQLNKVVSNCGGVNIKTRDNDNESYLAYMGYLSCYKKEGFVSSFYWSSTINSSRVNTAWGVYFHYADSRNADKSFKYNVRCVRSVP